MRLDEITQPIPKYLYHVTFTKNVPSITQKGLLQYQPSNWVKGEGGTRYNEEAGIFAFEHPEDAFKWAFKMRWDHKEPTSIVRLSPNDIWDLDPSQDINIMTGKGQALMSRRNIPAASIIDSYDMEDFSSPLELGINQDEWINRINKTLSESTRSSMPPYIAKKFMAIADMQRGAPEYAMLRVQRTMGGGVLSPVVEHVGDLLHRETEHADVGYWLEDIIREKVERGLRYLTYPYGFVREMKENIKSNNTDVGKLNSRLLEYAKEHEKLPVYNYAHYHSRQAAIELGYQNWDKAIEHLSHMKELLDKGAYTRVVSSYQLDSDGELIHYSP